MNITGIGTSFYNKSNIDNTGKFSTKELYLDQRTIPSSGATNGVYLFTTVIRS